jgi:hypothetical protein
MKTYKSKTFFAGPLLFLLLSAWGTVFADEKPFLTVEALLEDGYVQLTGSQLTALLQEHKIEIHDIETDAVYLSTRDSQADISNSTTVQTKNQSAKKSLDVNLLARAPMLMDDPERKVVGDELISSDGVRTYHIKLYEKQGRILGSRDIDHGDVFFEIRIK